MTRVAQNERLNSSYFRLRIEAPTIASLARPGQFAQIRRPAGWGLFIPISIYDIDREYIDLLIRIVGKGTESLSELVPNDEIEILGPLGQGFDLVDGQSILLVSGGIGYAALHLLDRVQREGNDVTWLHGGRTAQDVFPSDETWTDDGSLGRRGLVTEGLRTRLSAGGFDRVYACGPEPMLKACAGIAGEFGVPLQVSLEAYMACGVGACHGCAVGIHNGDTFEYQRVCKEGPVFDAKKVVWNES